MTDFVAFVKETLGDAVSDVRVSDRLTDSAVCLVATERGPDRQLERILAGAGQLAAKRAKPVLEINPKHDLVVALARATDEDLRTDAALSAARRRARARRREARRCARLLGAPRPRSFARPGLMLLGSVGELWRYPVKSMRGERLPAAHIETRGFAGDRRFAVYDAEGKIGSGKITRRFRPIAGLRAHSARAEADGVVIESPNGVVIRSDGSDTDAALTASLGQPVTLRRETDVAHHDAAPVHLITTTALHEISTLLARFSFADRALDAFPFRPNIVIQTDAPWPAEDGWIGRVIAIGDAVRLRITDRTERCIMVNTLPDGSVDQHIIQTIVRANESCLGVYASVEAAGEIFEGDAIVIE